MNKISVESDEKNITIKIPLDLIVYAQKLRDPAILINNKIEMGKTFESLFLDFPCVNSDDGRFTTLLDEFIDEMIEFGYTWANMEDEFEGENNE